MVELPIPGPTKEQRLEKQVKNLQDEFDFAISIICNMIERFGTDNAVSFKTSDLLGSHNPLKYRWQIIDDPMYNTMTIKVERAEP